MTTPFIPPRRSARSAMQARAAGFVLLALLALGAAACAGGDESVAEGSASAPIELAYPVASRESQVGPNTSSFYKVSGVSEGSAYTVSITELKDDADLFVYTDAGFSTIVCASAVDGTNNESCNTQALVTGVTALYIKVKSASEKGTQFNLTVN